MTTWGESHGVEIGCVVDGVPARIPLSEADIQPALDRRRPGQSRHTTQRQEADQVQIVSGVFDGMTTGTPIALIIKNGDQRSKDYGDIADQFRPGHADYSYQAKYGIRDYRGGGRSSARETAMRVAAGAIAARILDHALGQDNWSVKGALVQMGTRKIPDDAQDWSQIDANPFFCPSQDYAQLFADDLDALRKRGSSVGAVIELRATGFPAGLGDPIYEKLDANLAFAMMSINAVKAVEIGDGFATACLTGEENADQMRATQHDEGQHTAGQGGLNPQFLSNHAGGILGGISTGQPLVCRFAVKPTSSILIERQSINKEGENVAIKTKGRHDPCVGIRAVPVGEAMMQIVLADALLCARAIKL